MRKILMVLVCCFFVLNIKVSAIDIQSNDTKKFKVEILNMVDGRNLAGSKIKMKNEKNEIIDEWITEEKSYVIEGLEIGTYYLEVVSVPDGYKAKEKIINFDIKDTQEEIKIKIENVLNVEVADTLSNKSALLIAISMFDIALGIGIICYVKENKVTQ